MKLVNLLDVAEDHVALSPEGLGNVLPHQLRYVVLRRDEKQKKRERKKKKRQIRLIERRLRDREIRGNTEGTVTSIMYSRDLT